MPEQEKSGGMLARVKELLGLVTGAGILLYGLVYIVYSHFYSKLGVSPEEIGLGQASMLVHSIGYLIGLLLLSAFAAYIHARLAKTSHHRLYSSAFLVITITGMAVLFFLIPVRIADAQATDVQAGRSVVPMRFFFIPVLDVAASPVLVEWTNVSTPKARSLAAHKLFYLGASGGTSVFYDPTIGQSLRAPSGSVLVLALNCEAIPKLPEDELARCVGGIGQAGLNLSGIVLQGANLAGTNLAQDDLSRSDLSGALMAGANLEEASLEAADLRNADLRRANLGGVVLRGANLRGADLSEADLRGADLDEADLRDTIADDKTTWPPGFDPRANGVQFRE